MLRRFSVLAILLISFISGLSAFQIPRNSSQVVVGVTEAWSSSHLTVYLYEKSKEGRWSQVAGPWRGRCGKKGLAWGRGLHPRPNGKVPFKAEGDWRSPAGVFLIGGAWGYEKSIKKHPKLPYRKVTTRDLWVEDPKSKFYNQHLVLKHEPRPGWEQKAQMKQDDYPHSLKLFIAHNSTPKPVPGAGSSIFFHIWRGGGAKPTSGCTTLPEPALRALITRIDPTRAPVYVLLPKPDYDRLRSPWKLP